MRIKAWTIVLCYFFFLQDASAHSLDVAYLEIESKKDGGLIASLTVHPDAAYALVKKQVSDPISATELFNNTLSTGELVVEQASCVWKPTSIEQREDKVTLNAVAQCSIDARRFSISLPFLNSLEDSFRLYGKLSREGASETLFELRPSASAASLELNSSIDFIHMAWRGVEHIGAAPGEWISREGFFQLPDGIDHILFLLALLLVASNFKEMVLSATAFTVGHSITLILALLRIVELPVRLVESLVAFSIAIVAAEVFLKAKNSKLNFALAGVFGLIHGLGFAAALGALNFSEVSTTIIALAGFNIGVEVGQLILIIILAPGILWLNTKPYFAKYAKPALASIICLIGAYWFVLRAFALE